MTLHLNKKTRIFPKREISGSSQNIFISYNQRKKQSRAEADIFGTYSTSFWKVCVFLSVKSPNIFRKVWTKIIKTIAHNTKRRRPRFRKKIKSCSYKYSVSQDISNAGCKEPKYQRSVRKLAQPKRDSAFEQETRFVSKGRSEEVLKTAFLVTTKATGPPELRKTFLERTQPRFGKFLFCSRNKSCFYKYSISKDISNAGCKEPKYRTYRSKRSADETWLCIWTKNTYCSKKRDLRKFSKHIF